MRAGDQLVAHRAAVDIGILLQRVGRGEGRHARRGRRAARPRARPSMAIELSGEVRAHHLRDAALSLRRRRSPAKSSVERSVPDSVKRTSGKAMAMRLTTSAIAEPRRARPS